MSNTHPLRESRSRPAAAGPDYFGNDAALAEARQLLADGDRPGQARAALSLAWMLRQRNTRAALEHADDAQRLGCDDPGRLALTRSEAAWLFNRLDEAEHHRVDALSGFEAAGDALGLGDTALLSATMLDQVGGDRLGALADAERHYRAAAAPDRIQLVTTWRACAEATGGDAEHCDTVLDAVAATDRPGLAAYVEAARGTLAWRRGDPAAAIAAFQRGQAAAMASGQLLSAATLAQNIGIAFSTLNDHDGAMQWAERARDIVQPTGWTYHTGWCLMQTGAILVGLGRAAQARQLLLEGLQLFDGAQGSRNHVLACQALGEACLALHHDDEALRWCDEALAGAVAAPFPDLLSGLWRHQALALSRLNQPDDAWRSAQQALERAQADGDGQRVATIHHVLAQIALRHGRPPPPGSTAASGPIHHLQQALSHGERLSGFQPPPEWLHELSTAQQAVGCLDEALRCERLAVQALQAQQQRRSDEVATALLVRHQTAQALAEADRLRAQAEASELRAELLSTQAALDKERLQTMLVHAGKLAAIGRLAAGVVHEMSHPVGTVLLLSQSLDDALPEAASTVRRSLQGLVGETRRLQDLVTRLRHFARSDPLQVASHDLQQVLADARQIYGPRLHMDRIDVLESVLPARVLVDPQRLALALANLVFNAADALHGRRGGRVWLSTAPDNDLPADTLALHVDDNGPGLTGEAHKRLFEPFFTTRPQGLGLGLTLSSEALAAMGGRLKAGQRPGGGARFTLELPLAPRA